VGEEHAMGATQGLLYGLEEKSSSPWRSSSALTAAHSFLESQRQGLGKMAGGLC